MQEKYSLQIDHISRIYESAKDGIYKGDMKVALDGLQELRNTVCEAVQKIDLLTTPVAEPVQCVSGTCKAPYSSDYKELRPMPMPSLVDIESELFTWIWKTIKHWKVQAPDFYYGTLEVNGSHVKIIFDAIKSGSSK